MKPWRLFHGLLGIAGLAACAAAPSNGLEASWYLQESGAPAQSTLYLVLLNRGTEDRRITGLVLNSPDGTIGRGWKAEVDQPALPPGGLLVKKVGLFKRADGGNASSDWPGCTLPMQLIVLEEGNPQAPAQAQVPLAGQLPRALPSSWEACARDH